ncbi:MAG: hypothetical protein HY020_01640 [Burkholderiales bacterium]|nr:hypothetical protein [Burkholderiales bacterium]
MSLRSIFRCLPFNPSGRKGWLSVLDNDRLARTVPAAALRHTRASCGFEGLCSCAISDFSSSNVGVAEAYIERFSAHTQDKKIHQIQILAASGPDIAPTESLGSFMQSKRGDHHDKSL